MSSNNHRSPNVVEMTVIHKVFRREFALLPQLIRGVAEGDTKRAQVLAKHARFLLDGLHIHHEGEDELLWPKLLQRATAARGLIEEIQGQHERTSELMQRVTDELGAWERSAEASLRQHLAVNIDALRHTLLEHFDQEEARILPLVSEHITAAEWDELGEHGRAGMPRDQLPLMFGAILEDATPQEKAFVLAPIPPPIKLLLRTVGARKYRRYVREVRGAQPAST